MNRTWKDAACEVAWLKTWKARQLTANWELAYIRLKLFLAGVPCCLVSKSAFSSDMIKYEGTDFPTFRAAFMKWLDESEAKR